MSGKKSKADKTKEAEGYYNRGSALSLCTYDGVRSIDNALKYNG